MSATTTVAVGRAVGPYPAEALWAEPIVEAAAIQMRELMADRESAARIGERGREVFGEWTTGSAALARRRLQRLAGGRHSVD